MKKSNTSKYAYVAGLIESDGSITITQKRYGKEASNYFLRVTFSQKDGRMVDWLLGAIGGSAYLHYKTREKREAYHHWSIQHNQAKELLKKILPFLIMKKRQAEIGVQFQERVNVAVRKLQRNEKGQVLPNSVTLGEHEMNERKKLFEELKAEKHKYQFSKALNIQAQLKKSTVQL